MQREEESHTDHSAGLEMTSNALPPQSRDGPKAMGVIPIHLGDSFKLRLKI